MGLFFNILTSFILYLKWHSRNKQINEIRYKQIVNKNIGGVMIINVRSPFELFNISLRYRYHKTKVIIKDHHPHIENKWNHK